MKIKVDGIDVIFSKYIRAKHPLCQVCGTRNSTQIHHYMGRRFQSVRFSEENAWSVCFSCHRKFHENPEWAATMQKKRLGKGYDAFIVRANMVVRRRDVDRELLKMYFKQEMGKFS